VQDQKSNVSCMRWDPRYNEGRQAGGPTGRTHPFDTVWIHGSRCEGLHPTHGCPDSCVELLNSQRIEEHELCSDNIGDCHEWKREGVPSPCSLLAGDKRAGSGRSITPTKNVGAHDEVFVGVQGEAGPNEGFPPSRRRVTVVAPCMR
jgi:hypothetical protein